MNLGKRVAESGDDRLQKSARMDEDDANEDPTEVGEEEETEQARSSLLPPPLGAGRLMHGAPGAAGTCVGADAASHDVAEPLQPACFLRLKKCCLGCFCFRTPHGAARRRARGARGQGLGR